MDEDLVPISAIELEGFKCFGQLRLELKKLTILTGFNGAGKSSAIQPLLLLAQNYKRSGGLKKLSLNGDLVKLGTAGDIAHSDQAHPMHFSLVINGSQCDWDVRLRTGERSVEARKRVGPDISQPDFNVLQRVSYLGAVRAGAEDSFPIPENDAFIEVGNDGRYASYYFDQLADQPVSLEKSVANVGDTFRRQLDYWLSTLFPGARANVQSSNVFSQLHLEFRLSDLGEWRRPSNIGYGLTYAFPILVALLAAPRDQVIIIDSPESHLHPSAQSEMGRILAFFANAGVQIVVESHSDHLLNGIRLAIKDKVVAPSAVGIHFFAGASREGHGVTSPTIDADGSIHEWPEGFFDQNEKDLARLAGWN